MKPACPSLWTTCNTRRAIEYTLKWLERIYYIHSTPQRKDVPMNIDKRTLPKSPETIQKIKDAVRKAREANPDWKKQLSNSQKERLRKHPELAMRTAKYSIGDERMWEPGYVHVYIGRDRWVLKHRKIMQEHLGRELSPLEHIHHIDKNPMNNAIENLQIISNSAHQSVHHKGIIRSEESRRKQSESRKRLYAEGKLDRDCSRMHTPESISKMSSSMKKLYASGKKLGWVLMHEKRMNTTP